ncbi:hypothetical protein DYB37_000596 [Aphanomyces astaci]|uniref:RNA helicase n=1 Tax=Aphanomyces astaci TaxID=112090 RepID=A0A3R6ZYX1_APHAT|nr:hypothetical protein DYB35_003861 [Aphanomyces astaci]RHZ09537.1 hypothetical protein DYB37_000596 [Aphanomyces astaci]
MDAFRSLQVGASFNSKRFEKDIKLFKSEQNGPSGSGVTNTNIGAVDFFGFDKYVCMAVLGRNKSANKFSPSNHTNIRKAPIATKKVAAPPPRKDRSASVDVPLWAGAGEVAPVQKEGSKQRRKRKLSEDALAEAVVSDQDRKAVSQLLVPTTSTVTTSPKSKKKHRKKRTQRTASQGTDDDDEDTDEMTVFGKPTSTETSATTPHEPKAASHAYVLVYLSSRTWLIYKFLCVLSTCSDDIKALRRRLNITVEGTVVPDPVLEFAQMRTTATALKTVLLRNIEESQYKNPTPIQMQSIPSILKQRDVLGIAPTGSGKTAAFAIPMLLNLGAPDLKVSIHPSIHACNVLSTNICYYDNRTCTVNYDVVIATPLRLVHLITNDNVKLDSVEMICLDEADRLFDMGFVEQIDDVFAACTNPKMQRMMFSATMLQGVEEMAQSVLKDPIKISIGTKNAGTCNVKYAVSYIHRIGRTGRNGRQGEAVTLFTENDMVLVHLRTIANVMKLSGCDVPAWMLNLKKASTRQRKQLLKAPPERYRIETVSGYDLQKANKRRLMKAKADGTAATDDATADE